MTEMKWTPGPWEEIGLSVRVATRGIIATCPTPQGGGVMECFNNARLIAAAPDLFEAASALDAHWTEDFPSGPDSREASDKFTNETLHVWRLIRAALLKAGG